MLVSGYFFLWHQFRNTPVLPQNFKGQSSIRFLFIITVLQAKSSTPGCTVVWVHQHLDTYATAAQCPELWHSFSFHLAFHRWWDIEYMLIKCFLAFLELLSSSSELLKMRVSSHDLGLDFAVTSDMIQIFLSSETRRPLAKLFLTMPVITRYHLSLHCTAWRWGSLWNLQTLPLLHKKKPYPAAKEGYFLELCASQEVSFEIFPYERKV